MSFTTAGNNLVYMGEKRMRSFRYLRTKVAHVPKVLSTSPMHSVQVPARTTTVISNKHPVPALNMLTFRDSCSDQSSKKKTHTHIVVS